MAMMIIICIMFIILFVCLSFVLADKIGNGIQKIIEFFKGE